MAAVTSCANGLYSNCIWTIYGCTGGTNLVPRVLSPLPATPPTLRKGPGMGWSRVTQILGDNKHFVRGRVSSEWFGINIVLKVRCYNKIIKSPAVHSGYLGK